MNESVKTIAIITERGVPSKEIRKNTEINVFIMEGEKVSGYESIKLDSVDNDRFSALLELKKVSLVYIDTLNNELRRLLQKIGINVKCKDEWEGDDFIGKFVFGM